MLTIALNKTNCSHLLRNSRDFVRASSQVRKSTRTCYLGKAFVHF